MTDQIPADDLRRFIARYRTAVNRQGSILLDELEALLPDPPHPTLADMTLDEQDECAGMQADLAQGDRVVILDGTPDHDGLVQVLEKSLDVYSTSPENVTPRPDLPRLEWPSRQETDPTGPTGHALPDGFRLAEHPDYGRVIVTRPEPDVDGEATIIRPVPTSIDRARIDWCRPDELTYIDQEAGQ